MKSEMIATVLDKQQVYSTLYKEAHDHAYTAYIRGSRCQTEVDFFREISAALQFPWYFGENWAAFDECMCDLEWLSFQRLFLVIDDFRLVFHGNESLQMTLKKYLSIALSYWENESIPIQIWLNN